MTQEMGEPMASEPENVPGTVSEPSGEPDATDVLANEVAQDVRGVRVLTSTQFSLEASVGGIRGLFEALAPGIVFVVVFIVTRELTPTLVASLGIALLAVVIRLIQRTPLTQALSGILGVAVGVVWAWRTGDANDFFAFGLWTNAAYLVACLVSILVGWPIVGLIVELLKGASGAEPGDEAKTSADQTTDPASVNIGAVLSGWRADRALVRRYGLATWLWVGLFGIRLLVQLPLYLDGGEVGWLGTARLVMGVPLWALTLWLTWVLVRRPAAAQAHVRQRPDR